MRPLELIEALEKWELEEEFEVHIQNPTATNPEPTVVLAQNGNSINLTGKD